jgi:transcription elongation factor Elf1
MTIKCPKCGKKNKLAGHIPKDSIADGKTVAVLYCGFCGAKWTPKEKPK